MPKTKEICKVSARSKPTSLMTEPGNGLGESCQSNRYPSILPKAMHTYSCHFKSVNRAHRFNTSLQYPTIVDSERFLKTGYCIESMMLL